MIVIVPRAAHPRSRGENFESFRQSVESVGSSPLTRGKRLQGEADPVACRLIPAHAGKTGSFETLFIKSGAHPRSRGENEIVIALVRSGTGSSPLTRGKRASARSWSRSRRLIPAHAGKTLKTASIAPVDWAHPRSRGENNQPRSWTVELGGSSPLTRGKRVAYRTNEVQERLIPAHAGKTLWHDWHMRTREGSSPLTRGKQSAIARGPRLVGLIPAHAGKTRPKNRRKSASRAHPRSRGENQVEGHLRVVLAGSSPLTRGKPRTAVRPTMAAGLIPAHAGKTILRGCSWRWPWAHPRSRGENQLRVLDRELGRGLIPAHAGKTRQGWHPRAGSRAHPRSRGENSPSAILARPSPGSSPLTRGKLRSRRP